MLIQKLTEKYDIIPQLGDRTGLIKRGLAYAGPSRIIECLGAYGDYLEVAPLPPDTSRSKKYSHRGFIRGFS